jgi:transposase
MYHKESAWEFRRRRAIELVKEGERPSEIARFLDVSRVSVYNWKKKYRDSGDLTAAKKPGRPRRLSNEQLETLRSLLAQGAIAHGWANDLWTAKRVTKIIQRHFGIKFSIHHVRTILRDYLGWTSQRPIQQLKERNDAEIQRWIEQDFPRILRRARKIGAYLVFIDESGFMLAPIIRRTFAPRGKSPIIKVADPHGRISVAGAITVSPVRKRLGFLYHLLRDNSNFHGDSIVEFLDEIYHRISKPIIVLWDGFSIHSSEPVTQYLEQHRRITVEEFPPHASELNPVDKVWFYVKYDRLSNYTPATLKELRRRMIQEFLALKHKSNVLTWCVLETGLDLSLR